MPRQTKEWVATHPDQKVPPRVRLRVLLAYDRKCYLSGNPIPAGAAWELEHKVALILGGEHRESNLAPALASPHKRKTAAEMKVKAKIADVAKAAYGIKSAKARFPRRPKREKPPRDRLQQPPPRAMFQPLTKEPAS